MRENQRTLFRTLHADVRPLLLPNAWDVPSALLLEREGASAVATSSASLSWAHGYPDGGHLPRASFLAAIEHLLNHLTVPLTVDIEDGFSDDPERVADLVQALAGMGVAGINIEDADKPPQLLSEKIAAICGRCSCDPVFINARTDVYLRGLASGHEAIERTIERGADYAAAGADGLFVPGLSHTADMRMIKAECPLHLNLMMVPDLPIVSELSAAGISRVSTGPQTFLKAYGALAESAGAFLQGDVGAFLGARIGYDEMNALLE